VVAELTDNARSASKAQVVREAFEAMLKAITVGALDDGATKSRLYSTTFGALRADRKAHSDSERRDRHGCDLTIS